MRLFYFNLRINSYLLRTFTPHLGSFCVVSSFNTFRPNFTSGLLRIGMLSLVTVSPVITALLYIAPRFWPSKPLAGLSRIWNRYLLTMLTWNRRDSTPLSAAPRAPKGDQGWIFGLINPYLKKARGEIWPKRSERRNNTKTTKTRGKSPQ